jgi:hypothetical protein
VLIKPAHPQTSPGMFPGQTAAGENEGSEAPAAVARTDGEGDHEAHTGAPEDRGTAISDPTAPAARVPT